MLLDNEGIRTFLSTLSGHGVWSIGLFMLAGAIITLMLQSSATATAITMMLVALGYIPFTMATAMVLDSNLGTTVTSNIAASVANLSAKRTARAHFLFNLFGVILTLLFFRPFLDLVDAAYDAMEHNLATPLVELHTIENAEEAENAINVYRDQLRTEHLTNIEKSSYPYETGSFYMDLINCLEKMGDFIINISQSVLEAKTV